MIRVIQRRIMIPRGDTGSFSIPTLIKTEEGDIAVFSVFDSLTQTTVLEKIIPATEGTLTIPFEHEDTANLEPGKYNWDIKIYCGPKYDEDGVLIGGENIHSYYSAYSLPIFEITEITENVSRTKTPNA